MWNFINANSLNGSGFSFVGSFFDIIYLLNISTPITSSAGDLVWRFLQIILATIFVVLLSYYSIKMFAIARGRQRRKGSNLTIVESIAVGQHSMVQVVRAGDKYLVIGVTKERVTLLSELDSDEVLKPEPITFDSKSIPFANVLNKFLPPNDEINNNENGVGPREGNSFTHKDNGQDD